MRGNVLDLAIAVIIGGAFATITKSLTDDVIMPVVGWLFGGFDFSSYFIRLGPIPESYAGSPTNYAALKEAGVPLFGYGAFITATNNFLILAFILFLPVSYANTQKEIGRASCREGVCQDVESSGVDVSLNKKQTN